MAVSPVGARYGIAARGVYNSGHPYRHGLLTDAQMRRAPDDVFDKQFLDALLADADFKHPLKHVAAHLGAQFLFFCHLSSFHEEKACKCLSNTSRKRASTIPSTTR